MLPFSHREGIWRFGVGENFAKFWRSIDHVGDVRRGNCRFSRSSVGYRRFAEFAAVGDWDVQPAGSGAGCLRVFLLREIEIGFG